MMTLLFIDIYTVNNYNSIAGNSSLEIPVTAGWSVGEDDHPFTKTLHFD